MSSAHGVDDDMSLQATQPAPYAPTQTQPWFARNRRLIIRHGVINLFMVIIILPLAWVLLLSIKSLPDSMRGQLWPRNFDYTHYGYVFDKIATLPQNMFNSIYVTGATVLITTICAVLAGYRPGPSETARRCRHLRRSAGFAVFSDAGGSDHLDL